MQERDSLSRISSRVAFPSCMLASAACLLIVTEVFIRSGPWTLGGRATEDPPGVNTGATFAQLAELQEQKKALESKLQATTWQVTELSRQLRRYQGDSVSSVNVGPAAQSLLSHWDKSDRLVDPWSNEEAPKPEGRGDAAGQLSGMPQVDNPPHLEDCMRKEQWISSYESRAKDGGLPDWPPWSSAAPLPNASAAAALSPLYRPPATLGAGRGAEEEEEGELLKLRPGTVLGPSPPWVSGSDDSLLPLTRRAQHDLWVHQHPRGDCSPSASTRFLVVDAVVASGPRFLGLGAQINWLAGALAEALKQDRVMVIRRYERAEHESCAGPHFGRWSCYFVPETSDACRKRALELAPRFESKPYSEDALVAFAGPPGVATERSGKRRSSTAYFFYYPPDWWGTPWSAMPSTQEIAGEMLPQTPVDDLRWWFAQASRYLLRSPSSRLCVLANRARHAAFGPLLAAELAASHAATSSLLEAAAGKLKMGQESRGGSNSSSSLEHLWSSSSIFPPLIPPGLLSLHVRQGDKAKEMKIFQFAEYMGLAARVRRTFPEASSVWLSTEMEAVVNQTLDYPDWSFFYTRIPRQGSGGIDMKIHERKLGPGALVDDSFVNLLMAAESKFFVGTLGSTWSVLIDNLRVTGGKLWSGFLSVNEDRFWREKKAPRRSF